MSAYSTYTDHELVVLLKVGDEAALTEIYSRYQPILYSHAYRRFPDREQVRDIIQDLFAYLWNNRENLQFNSLSAYLYSSVRNKILNNFRDQKVKDAFTSSLLEFIDQGHNATEEWIRERELVRLVEKEVANLPSQMRLIFEMSRNVQLSHQEIADELQLSPHTVRTQVKNALRILRVKLGTIIFMIFF